MAGAGPITVVETPEFLSATRKLLSDEERTVLEQDRNDFKRLTAILVASFKRRRT